MQNTTPKSAISSLPRSEIRVFRANRSIPISPAVSFLMHGNIQSPDQDNRAPKALPSRLGRSTHHCWRCRTTVPLPDRPRKKATLEVDGESSRRQKTGILEASSERTHGALDGWGKAVHHNEQKFHGASRPIEKCLEH